MKQLALYNQDARLPNKLAAISYIPPFAFSYLSDPDKMPQKITLLLQIACSANFKDVCSIGKNINPASTGANNCEKLPCWMNKNNQGFPIFSYDFPGFIVA